MISSSIHLASSPSHSRSSNPPARWLRCSIRRDAHSLSESRLPTSLGSLFGAEAGATRRSSSTTPTSAGLYYCSGSPGFEAAKLLLSALWRSVHQLRDAYSRRIKRVTRGGRALRRDRCRTTCFRAVSACKVLPYHLLTLLRPHRITRRYENDERRYEEPHTSVTLHHSSAGYAQKLCCWYGYYGYYGASAQ